MSLSFGAISELAISELPAVGGGTGNTITSAPLVDAGDTMAAALSAQDRAAIALTEAGDTFAATIKLQDRVSATLVEASDTLAANLQTTLRITAALQESGDTFFANLLSGSGPAAPTGGVIPVYARRKGRR